MVILPNFMVPLSVGRVRVPVGPGVPVVRTAMVRGVDDLLAAASEGPSGSLPDAELLRRLVARDEEALGALYDRHSGYVYALLLRLLDESRAQEVLQDVFLRLWQAPERYDPVRAELRSFLLVMARSRALDRLRQERGEWRLYDDQGEDFPLPDERQSPFDRAAGQQRREALQQAMAHLSEAQRETVRRAFLLGESREETAQAMGVPVGTVKSRLNTALAHLKRLLGERLGASLEGLDAPGVPHE